MKILKQLPVIILLIITALMYACQTEVNTAEKDEKEDKPVEKTYAIGETGPAGGLVFYDKGSYSGGWRYIEAAPLNTEPPIRYQWGSINSLVGASGTAIGTGKSNTEIIVLWLNTNGEIDKAAQYCYNLTYNNFSDWYLPSLDEVIIMRTNLYLHNLGDFKSSACYWTSSEAGANSVGAISFQSGGTIWAEKNFLPRLRAVRYF